MSAPPVWIDSHCHLDSLDDPGEAVARARQAGVGAIVTVGDDLASSRRCIERAAAHDGVWAAVGVHPHHAEGFLPEALAELEALAASPRVVAIGEIGLDHYRDLSPRDAQRDAFAAQLGLARRLGMPVVLHVRDAFDEVFDVLGKTGPLQGCVFHCFSGGPAEAARAIALGAHLSFAGNVSFRNAEGLRDAARSVPLERLLVETDSPYLAPVPHRGKPNEPAMVAVVGEALARALGREPVEVAEATTAAARRVLGLG